jgi:hypothetical protein
LASTSVGRGAAVVGRAGNAALAPARSMGTRIGTAARGTMGRNQAGTTGNAALRNTARGAARVRKVHTGDYTYDDLGPLGPNLEGTLGVTDSVTGNIRINSQLPQDMFDATLRHELVHQRIVRGPISGPISRALYSRSAIWTYGEEALAESVGSRSLSAGLRHPVVNGYICRSQVGFDAVVLGGGGVIGYRIYEAEQ